MVMKVTHFRMHSLALPDMHTLPEYSALASVYTTFINIAFEFHSLLRQRQQGAATAAGGLEPGTVGGLGAPPSSLSYFRLLQVCYSHPRDPRKGGGRGARAGAGAVCCMPRQGGAVWCEQAQVWCGVCRRCGGSVLGCAGQAGVMMMRGQV